MSLSMMRRSAVAAKPSSRRPSVAVRASANTSGPTSNAMVNAALAPVMAVMETPAFKAAMSFSGPAPETVNGRLAMIGFIHAVGAEVITGRPLLEQAGASAGTVLATFVVFSLATLAPILKGANLTEAFGPLTPDVERLNGRMAMLGMVALAGAEYVKGSALF